MPASRVPAAFWARPFAHRGLHSKDATENSLAAVVAAVDGGYGIEIDIQPSGDGTPMVFHDYELERLTSVSGKISEKSDAELADLSHACGNPISSLATVLDAVAGRAPLLIEIKDQDGAFGPNIGALESQVARLCETYCRDHGEQTLSVMSFNPHSVGWFKTNAPGILRGLVACNQDDETLSPDLRARLAACDSLPENEADFVSYGWRDLPTDRTNALRASGMPVFCWTIRSDDEAQDALKHCDQITFEQYFPNASDGLATQTKP